MARPARTIRFVFPPEIEGTMALLTSKEAVADEPSRIGADGDPVRASLLVPLSFTQKIKAVVHMDMVGGGPETKAVFHVTRGPMSLPSFVHDVAWAFAEWVNEESYEFAATGKAEYPLVSTEGGRDPLRAEYSAYSMGSDHDVYQDSSFGIPAIYLNDWPDRYIHTNFDTAANIDPTKLKRAAFIGAESGYFLAQIGEDSAMEIPTIVEQGRHFRTAEFDRRILQLTPAQKSQMRESFLENEVAITGSPRGMIPRTLAQSEVSFESSWSLVQMANRAREKSNATGEGLLKVKRRADLKGPMTVFGYDYFEAEWAKRGHTTQPKLLEYAGLWGGGEEYAYEVLNFADGKRNAQEMRDAVSAEYGPVPLELVVEYLKALQEIGVVEAVK